MGMKEVPVCDPVSELDTELWWLERIEENIEDRSSNRPLDDENDIECRLGDTGLDVPVGDTDADKIGGEPGGVSRGVLVWDANRRPCDTWGLKAARVSKQQN